MKRIPLIILSKYRQEVMGLSILGVIFIHLLAWVQYKNPMLEFCGRILFTETFLFFSGFGLYYSFTKNRDISSFYKKRLTRILIPFLIIAGTFYFVQNILIEHKYSRFLSGITTLKYWIFGNDGTWYISVQLILYLLFPLFYKISHIRGGNLCLIIFLIALSDFIYFISKEYYMQIHFGLTQIPFFIIGTIVGKDSIQGKRIHIIWLPVVFILMLFTLNISTIFPIYSTLQKIFGIMLFAWIFFLCDKLNCYLKEKIYGLLSWLGKHSLELYLLHLLLYEWLKQLNTTPSMIALIDIIIAMLLAHPTHVLCTRIQKNINKT